MTLDKQIQLATLNNSRVSSSNVSHTSQFNLSSAVKVMPKFSEGNVDEFFCAFERFARVMNWQPTY